MSTGSAVDLVISWFMGAVVLTVSVANRDVLPARFR